MQARKLTLEEWEHSKSNYEQLLSQKRVEDLHDRLVESYDANYDGKVFFCFFFWFLESRKNIFVCFIKYGQSL